MILAGLRVRSFSAQQIAFFAICDKVSNSAFVNKVITISCLLAFQDIKPLNSLIV
jgi:hypothetical protein